jgi:hypothetical protein
MGSAMPHSNLEHYWLVGRTPQNKKLTIRHVMVFTPLPAAIGTVPSAKAKCVNIGWTHTSNNCSHQLLSFDFH